MKTTLVARPSLLVAGIVVLAVTGCGGSDIASYDAPTATPSTPATPGTPATPVVPSTPGAPVRVGDFAFASAVQGSIDQNTTARNVTLAADGTGSITLLLQSVNGFSAPITFPYTVTIAGPHSETFDANQAAVSVTPATLTGLPVGTTSVALSVRTNATLPPLTRITVDLHAEGGGLKRYPNVNAYENNGDFVFTTPGFAFSTVSLLGRLNTASGSTLNGYGSYSAAGLSGTGTLSLSGLPNGVAATFDKPTITLPLEDDFQNVTITLRSGQNVTPGTYPVRLNLTLNGTTYTSEVTNLLIESTVSVNQ